MVIEDPVRHLGYLRQCLASDKKPLGLFLGAGCPMAVANSKADGPLIPDVAGITKLVQAALADSEGCKDVLKAVCAHFDEDGHANATIEDMLTHIRALMAVAGKAEVRGLSANALAVLDHSICDFIQKVVDVRLPDLKTPYHHVASWVDGTARQTPVEIFTSNYDLLMEQALEECGVAYFDGFAGSRQPRFNLRAMEEDLLPSRCGSRTRSGYARFSPRARSERRSHASHRTRCVTRLAPAGSKRAATSTSCRRSSAIRASR